MATPGAVDVARKQEAQHLDSSINSLIDKVAELKKSLEDLVTKIERDHHSLTWPSLLDSMYLASGQMSSIRELLSNEKFPRLINYAMLPVSLSLDGSSTLSELTEGRVNAFNHDVVPMYMRTKPEPEVEERVKQVTQQANTIPPAEALKQVEILNRTVASTVDILENARQNRLQETTKRVQSVDTFRREDTVLLAATMSVGARLQKPSMPLPRAQQPPITGSPGPRQAKAASSIRTNIKAGGVGSHPYSRP